jgi:hypothetical protein
MRESLISKIPIRAAGLRFMKWPPKPSAGLRMLGKRNTGKKAHAVVGRDLLDAAGEQEEIATSARVAEDTYLLK